MTGLENPTHILFVLIIAVLVFGPKRLPDLGGSLGAGIREFRGSLAGEERSAPEPQVAGSPAQEGSVSSAPSQSARTSATSSSSG